MKKRKPSFPIPEKIKSSSHNRQTIEKALIWLREEKQELAGHITDVNLAVRLYLKDQERKKEKVSFMEEWPLYKNSPHENSQKATNDFPLSVERNSAETSFLLDKKSREVVEQVQSQLNISAEAALKVLIQLGCRTLQTLFK